MPTGTWDRLVPERRAAVVAAAETEFAARGFSGASMNTICREAGVSKGSLFQYFTDKADMYVYLAEQSSERIRSSMEAVVLRLDWDADFFAALESLLDSWVRYFYDHPLERAMTAAANLEPDPVARTAVREAVDKHYLAVLRPLIGQAVDTGALRPDAEIDVLLALLLLMLPHLALAPHVEGLDPLLGLAEGDADHAAETARRVVLTALAPYRAG
ncbi:TetR/AcrR family transcriptional regulator [Nocardia asteroides NBRC 15531]|uniref:TetR family transcriptional regulator n=1 Tax=Nocardia asteroides NBRC 15531 TaxID=1110697 RepID=U5ELR9_NOCAS|nr:TetR/AcrR family transcriptional regulator [Nocardia asteroides]TLF63588.1 TetR/AcrR family transcriptional regulator [Nocardia asteroides NBRC 15531]UGT46959.1 TetR/AcrR family transcriptional regulator [Nocardia asteroides]SFM83593.1 transcriptional regulator, TetR family [Nocardia asteroides]VEG34175.1 HTH-type transcriptional repressor AcnR [Nocardia asteroides]GAD87336.1 putative TetR family transcriptional regulator [Nocardia asteroides NBRC 15531]